MVNGQSVSSPRAAAASLPAVAFHSIQVYYLQAHVEHHPGAQGPERRDLQRAAGDARVAVSLKATVVSAPGPNLPSLPTSCILTSALLTFPR